MEDWNYRVDTSKKISFDKYKEIIDEGSKNDLFSVEFNGINEPLLKKDICRYIKYIHEKQIPVSSLHTNATLLTEDRSKDLIDSGLKIIIFSVDAIKASTYNKIRVGSDYDRVLKNINYFLDIRKQQKSIFPLVQMSFSKNKFNYEELPDYIKYWESKVDFISTSSFSNPFMGGSKEKYAEEKYRYDSYIMEECYEPFQRLLIRNDGKVHFCCSFFGGEKVIGDIYENSISEIWHCDKLNKVRSSMNSDGEVSICQKCKQSMRG